MTRRRPMPERIPASRVRLKRAYLPASAADGTRILVDRLWPRGIRKSAAAIDLWIKDVAPSTALRGGGHPGTAPYRARSDAMVMPRGQSPSQTHIAKSKPPPAGRAHGPGRPNGS